MYSVPTHTEAVKYHISYARKLQKKTKIIRIFNHLVASEHDVAYSEGKRNEKRRNQKKH